MKSFCTKGIFFLSLALLLVGAAACTQSKPAVPTPTLVPLGNDTIGTTPDSGQPTAIIIDQVTPSTGGEQPTLVPPPSGNETAVPAIGATPAPGIDSGQPTPIIVEPTLLPTPTTVGDTGQPVATPAPGTENNNPSSGACSNPYTVQPGEWFYAIARKCGVTPEALLAANPGLNPNLLRPGQTLNIPGGSTGGGAPPVATADSGQTQPPPSGGACPNPYTVQQGDTLNSIARKCGTTVAALQQANGIPAPDYIFPGQQLRIP